MKSIFCCTVVLFVFFSCKKNTDNCLKEVQMSVQYSVIPGTANPNSSFNIRLGVTGSDLCWKYLRTDIKAMPNKVFELRPYGSYPCTPRACATAIYEAADTLAIPTTTTGTYRIDIYSSNTLLSSTNVIVN